MLKVLFADDHLKQQLSDSYIRGRIKEVYPHLNEHKVKELMSKHREYLAVMPRALAALKDDGYEVICADSYQEAMTLAASTTVDIAIVDMGWFLDKDLPPNERDSAGWHICDAIRKADTTAMRKSTPRIVYSNRFADIPLMGHQAAANGILPVFKNESEASYLSLKASVKFISTYLTNPSPAEILAHNEAARLQRQLDNLVTQPLEQERKWANATLTCVCASVALILAGVAAAYYGHVTVGTVSASSSIITAVVSSIFYSQLRRQKGDLKEIRKELQKEFEQVRKWINEAESRVS